jgi:hypothetical protein
MYLVHAHLMPPSPGRTLPPDVAVCARTHARPQDRLEHACAHPLAHPHPVLGVYLLADSLAQAESNAARLCRRVLSDCPALHGWTLLRAHAPLLLDPLGQGPFGPAETPSAPSDLRRK